MPVNQYENIQIHGLDEIERKLQALPERLRRKRLKSILKDGAERIQAEAIRQVPTRAPLTGWLAAIAGTEGAHLRDNIVYKVSITTRRAVATVGIDYSNVHHGHLVEFGTRPHFTHGWLHPGARAQPFMRPAYDATARSNLDKIISSLRRAVEMEAGERAF